MLLKTINNKNRYDKNDKFTRKIDEIIFDEITNIDLKNKCVFTKNKTTYWNNGYLVCGLGSNVDIGKKWLPIINENKNHNIKKRFCIVGTGPTGTELAFYLSDLGHCIDIFDIFIPDI